MEEENITQRKAGNNNFLVTCPDILSSDYTTLELAQKIRIEYDDVGMYPVVSWESNNPLTTTLDYDGGDWAYFHNNGYGYLEVKLTVLAGGVQCTSYDLVYY